MQNSFDLCISLFGVLVVAWEHFAITEALHFAEVLRIAPFNYTSIAWAGVAGYLVIMHRPNTLQCIGHALLLRVDS